MVQIGLVKIAEKLLSQGEAEWQISRHLIMYYGLVTEEDARKTINIAKYKRF